MSLEFIVNGTTGEGMSMTVIERKKTAEHWKAACRKYDLNLMLQIGGASIADVLDLVRYYGLIKSSFICIYWLNILGWTCGKASGWFRSLFARTLFQTIYSWRLNQLHKTCSGCMSYASVPLLSYSKHDRRQW